MMMMMWWIVLCIFSAVQAAPVKICVPKHLSEFCSKMQSDLPETFQCVTQPDTLRCIKSVHKGEADITNVDPSGVYLAGKFYDLRPIATELYEGGIYRYESIALVRKGSSIQSPADLRHRASCHTGFARNAGWQIPVGRLLAANLITPNCVEGELAEVRSFFNTSCVPGPWSFAPEVDAKLKAKYPSLCSRCKDPTTCSVNDAYAGYQGVLKCLNDNAADVAFTKIIALKQYLQENPDFKDKAELLCFEGGRKSVDDKTPCVWGHRYTNAYVAKAGGEERLIKALLDTQTRYSVPQARIPDWYYQTFLSHSEVTGLKSTEQSRNTYVTYLGDFLNSIRKPRRGCEGQSERHVSFCVTSDEEKAKCEDFSHVAESMASFWPDINCVKTASKEACMEAVKENNAQMLILDGGDVYKAGRYYGLQPIASELYGKSDVTYYAVAVQRSASDVKNLTQLKGLRSCHTGIGRTAGWVMPLGALLSKGLIKPGSTCNHADGVADFFSAGSCVPGANDTKSNPGRIRSGDLCKHCIGDDQGQHKCARDSSERYSGYAGAFRCLAQGSGDIAFVKHRTVPDYTDGNGKEAWTRNLISTDFVLLCDGGGTAPVLKYERCNLGKVPSHQVVTGGNLHELRRLHIARLLSDASKFLSSDKSLFRLFGAGDKPDLLFKDSASGLKIVPLNATYQEVLGQKFIEALRAADPRNCGASQSL